MDLSAYILAGGKSSRFGSDKARAEVGGEALIARIARLAREAGAPRVFAVAREAGAYDDLGVPTLADLRPGLGPLSGLEAALTHCGEGWILLLTCDQLVCEKAWVEALVCAAKQPDWSPALPADLEVGVPGAAVFHDGARFQPVPGLYHARLLPRVSALLGSGAKASFQSLLASASGVVKIAMPADWPEKLQANAPEDLPG